MARDESNNRTILGDTDIFFFYLRGGKYERQAARVITQADSGRIDLRTSSEVYDDAISAIRSSGAALEVAQDFAADMRSIPHKALPMSAEIADEAMRLYILHGGRGRLSYFDAFHVATSKRYHLALLTSDSFILENSNAFGASSCKLSLWT